MSKNISETKSNSTSDPNGYERRYQQGYGHTVPEGHVIRIHHQILKYELDVKGGSLLDFGCGIGANAKWLAENGNWIPHGCDVSGTAIEIARKSMPKWSENFFVTDPVPNLPVVFNRKFDFIFSNQVLCYFNDKQLRIILDQFHSLLNPGGLFFASMMTPENYWYSKSVEIPNSEMRQVELRGRINATYSLNFKTVEKMENDFRQFKKLHGGYYDFLIREDEGSGKCIWYLGQKT